MTKTFTFIFDDKKFKAKDIPNGKCAMEQANNYFDLPEGAWFGNKGTTTNSDSFVWVKGNFFD